MDLKSINKLVWNWIKEFNIGLDLPSHNALIFGAGVIVGLFAKQFAILAAILYLAYCFYNQRKSN